MAHDVFISYASADKTTADAITARLEARGLRCWIAPRDVQAGVHYAESILDAIKGAKLLVLVFSSQANSSAQVLREVERAVSLGLPIMPFRIEEIPPSKAMEYFISTPHWLDALTPPMEAHIERLADNVEHLIRSGQGAPPVPSIGQRMLRALRLVRFRAARALRMLAVAAVGGVFLVGALIGWGVLPNPFPFAPMPPAGESEQVRPARGEERRAPSPGPAPVVRQPDAVSIGKPITGELDGASRQSARHAVRIPSAGVLSWVVAHTGPGEGALIGGVSLLGSDGRALARTGLIPPGRSANGGPLAVSEGTFSYEVSQRSREGGTSSYRIESHFQPFAQDSAQNFSRSSAKSIAAGQAMRGLVGFGRNLEDWFAFSNRVDGVLTVSLSNETQPRDTQNSRLGLELHDSQGKTLDRISNIVPTRGQSSEPLMVSGDSSYSVRVAAVSGNAGAYRLELGFEPLPETRGDPGHEAGSLRPGEGKQGRVGFRGNPIDRYRIPVQQSGTLTFTVTNESPQNTSNGSIQQIALLEGGRPIARHSIVPPGRSSRPQSVSLRAGGSYMLEIHARGGGHAALYRLETRFDTSR